MPVKISIVIVDDRPQNRFSLAEKINLSDDIEVKFTAEDGNDFLDKMKALTFAQLPQIVLMDIEMPVMNGIEAVRIGKQLYPSVKFLMLTVFDDDDKIFEAIQAGAGGYILKEEKVASIIEYIYQLHEINAVPMSPGIARKVLDMLGRSAFQKKDNNEQDSNASQLSEREIEVLKLMVDGYDYRSTAEKLFLSTHTIRRHIANIYAKLHVSSKAQAIKIATNDKLV